MIGPFYTDSKGNTTTSLEDHLIVNAKNRYNEKKLSRLRMPKITPALICLQRGCTEYLKKFDERISPFELPIINLELLFNINSYPPTHFLENSREIMSTFANNFQNKYHNMEQIYIYSALGPTNVEEEIYSAIPNIFMKRTIIVPEDIYWLDPRATQFDKIRLDGYLNSPWVRNHIPPHTNEEEILEIVKNSLNFHHGN